MSPARRVLIVDDEAMIRLVACEVVAEAGFEPMDAATGDQALEIVEVHGSDLAAVVTDIKMPGSIDGLELAERIRAQWPTLHVIVVSGSPFDLPEGCTALMKPYRQDELENALALTGDMSSAA